MTDWWIDWFSCVFAVSAIFQQRKGGDYAKMIVYEIFKFPSCKKRRGYNISGDGRYFERAKTEAPCHSRCNTIKIPPCLNATSPEQRLKRSARHRQLWSLHMNKIILSNTIKQSINLHWHMRQKKINMCSCGRICPGQ